jgi:tetratricopeptide (TPR) repeat protein
MSREYTKTSVDKQLQALVVRSSKLSSLLIGCGMMVALAVLVCTQRRLASYERIVAEKKAEIERLEKEIAEKHERARQLDEELRVKGRQLEASQLASQDVVDAVVAGGEAKQVPADLVQRIRDIADTTTDPKTERARAKWRQGYAEALHGNEVLARKHYQEALEVVQNYAPALNSLGVLEEKQRTAESRASAIQYYKRALASQPEYVAALWNLGRIEYHYGDLAAARTFLEKMLELRPNDRGAQLLLNKIMNADPSTSPPRE